jgi:multiple sugar transport system substrate-binding protein
MRNRNWSFLYFSVLTAVVLLVSIVGQGYQVASAAQTVTVTLGSWDDENGNKRHIAVIQDFMAQNPDIKVEIVPKPAGDWHSTILTWIAAGTLPDVYMVDSGNVGAYADAGGLENLKSYIEGKDGFDPSKVFYESVYKNGFYKGDPYLLAKDYSTVAIYANQSLFDAAGIPLPKEGWTYDDLLRIAQQLTVDKNGNNATSPDFDPANITQYGMDHRAEWWRGFQTVIYSFGSHTISEDGKTLDGYINSEKTIAALQWMKDAVHKHHVAPTTNWIKSLPGEAVIPQYLDGKIAMVFGYGPWFLGSLEEKPGFKYAIVPMPTGPGGHHSAVCWAGFGLAPTSKNKDAAWKLLKALGTEIGQKQYGEHALSSMPAIMESKKGHPFWTTFIEEVKYLDPLDDLKNPYYTLCVDVEGGKLIPAVLFGEEGANLDVKELVNKVMPDLQRCMDEHGKMPATPASS